MNNPLVSIIIPVYNGSNYLGEAIDSALKQTYKNIEIIVVNDGSTDGGKTEELALSYGDKIRYFKKENGGVSTALNYGISKMQGEYFSWLSHDDAYTETKIENQIKHVGCNKDVIVVCNERQIDKDSKFLSEANDYSKLIKSGVIKPEEELCNLLTQRAFSGCALLIPKHAFEKAGLFDEGLRYNQDFDMWVQFAINGYSWKFISDVGVLSRVHAGQVTQTRRDLFYKDSYTLGKRLIPEFERISTKEYNFLYLYAKKCGKYNLSENVKLCKEYAKKRKLFSASQKLSISLTSAYGKIRPAIRRLYYKLFKKVKTQ